MSDSENCPRLEKSYITPSIPSVVTSFSVCPTSDLPVQTSSHFSQESADESKGSLEFSSSCRVLRNEREIESAHGNAPQFVQLQGNITEFKGEKQGNEQKQQTKDNPIQHSQKHSPQFNRQQQDKHLSQQLHQEDDDQHAPFTSNVFSQRRNLFQQEESRTAICGEPVVRSLSPPLLRRTKSHDLSVKQANLRGPQTDGSWASVRDCNDAVPFGSHFTGHSQTRANGSLQEKQWLESLVRKESFSSALKKPSSFREHLNQMVPEFLKVNNSSNCFKTSNLARNKPNDTRDDDDDGVIEGLSNGSHKVRFNLTELSSI